MMHVSQKIKISYFDGQANFCQFFIAYNDVKTKKLQIIQISKICVIIFLNDISIFWHAW